MVQNLKNIKCCKKSTKIRKITNRADIPQQILKHWMILQTVKQVPPVHHRVNQMGVITQTIRQAAVYDFH